MFTARYGMIPYIKQITFRLSTVQAVGFDRCMLGVKLHTNDAIMDVGLTHRCHG